MRFRACWGTNSSRRLPAILTFSIINIVVLGDVLEWIQVLLRMGDVVRFGVRTIAKSSRLEDLVRVMLMGCLGVLSEWQDL